MSCFRTITRAARAEVPPRPTEQRIYHEGTWWRRVTGAELHAHLRVQLRDFKQVRSPASQRKARAQARAAALGVARHARPLPVAALASTASAAASASASSEASASSGDDGGSEDDSTGAGDEPAVARHRS